MLSISALSKLNNVNYTRYADDLTFSSNDSIHSDFILDIINIIKKNQFDINEKKIRLRYSNQKQIVTGIIVNEKPNVDRKLIRKIRAITHDIRINGADEAARKHFGIDGKIDSETRIHFVNKIGGYINFVGQVRGFEDLLYNNLLRNYKQSF